MGTRIKSIVELAGTLLQAAREVAARQGATLRGVFEAAPCLQHGVTVLWSADRDFSRFPALRVANPLLKPRT